MAAVVVAAVVAMLVQSSVLAIVPRLPVVPDLILVLVVHLGLRYHGVGGVVGAFLLGYFLDTFSGTVPGMNAFAMTAVWVAVYLVARSLWTQGWFSAVVVVFFGGCVRQVAVAAVATLVERPAPVWQHVWWYGLWEAAIAAAVAPAVFAFVDWEYRRLGVA